MSEPRTPHLVERAVERMAELGIAPGVAPGGATSGGPAAPGGTVNGAGSGAAASGTDRPLPAATASGAVLEQERPTAATPATATPAIPLAASPGAGTAAPPEMREPPREIDMATLQAAGMVVSGARRSRVAEEWGVAAGRLMRTLRDIRIGAAGSPFSNLLLVTSAKPNEGKTFSAINLAGSLILGGFAEVLLVDLDNKPGALTEVFGLAGQPGLYDMAADPALRPEDLVVPTALPGFCVLPIGHAPAEHPTAADRTITRPVVSAIERLARRFAKRLVIFDRRHASRPATHRLWPVPSGRSPSSSKPSAPSAISWMPRSSCCATARTSA